MRRFFRMGNGLFSLLTSGMRVNRRYKGFRRSGDYPRLFGVVTIATILEVVRDFVLGSGKRKK